MNKLIVILLPILILLGVALYVHNSDNNSFSENPLPLSDDGHKAMDLLNLAKEGCLSGESRRTVLGTDIVTNFRRKLKASVSIEKDNVKGAVNYMDEEIRQIEDDKIRNCLQKHMQVIQDCLLGNCNASALPKNIEFQFTYRTKEQNKYLYGDRVAFSILNRPDNRFLLLQPGKNYYVDSIELMDEGKQYNAAIYGVVREGYLTDYDESTKFCLEKSSSLQLNASKHTRYHCDQTKGCEHSTETPRWFDLCEMSTSGKNRFSFSLVKSAYAEQADKIWAIPSLETLKAREDLLGIGYTHFTVETTSPLNIKADGYYFDISVNGWKANVNGLEGNFNAKSHNFTRPLKIEFGLQNLNFSGEKNGCDRTSVTLHFLKNGEVVGVPVEITRSYVALRDARVKEFVRDGGIYRWGGKYQRAPKEYDTEVFVSSILISRDLDFQANRLAMERAKTTISDMKTKFDQMGFVFEGHPLVAVIRPPLTQISYGLAIGMVEETQQIRFTYDNVTAKRLKQFLLNQRAKGSRYQRIIKSDTFLYPIRGNKSYMASPPVCWDES